MIRIDSRTKLFHTTQIKSESAAFRNFSNENLSFYPLQVCFRRFNYDTRCILVFVTRCGSSQRCSIFVDCMPHELHPRDERMRITYTLAHSAHTSLTLVPCSYICDFAYYTRHSSSVSQVYVSTLWKVFLFPFSATTEVFSCYSSGLFVCLVGVVVFMPSPRIVLLNERGSITSINALLR